MYICKKSWRFRICKNFLKIFGNSKYFPRKNPNGQARTAVVGKGGNLPNHRVRVVQQVYRQRDDTARILTRVGTVSIVKKSQNLDQAGNNKLIGGHLVALEHISKNLCFIHVSVLPVFNDIFAFSSSHTT